MPFMMRCLLSGLLALSFGSVVVGCNQQPEATPTTGLATQAASPEAISTYNDANLAELTREVRRYIVATKQRPTSFEQFATEAKITVPPPPAGKKYSLSKEMRVVLVEAR